MITDTIIDILVNPIMYILDLVPLPSAQSLVVPTAVFTELDNILQILGFFFPMKLIVSYLGLFFFFDMFTIMWALVIRLKSFIPFGRW